MDLIQKIVKSRITLKEILSKDYNTDDLPIYSVDEMDKLYKLQLTSESPLKILGDNGLPCHFTLKHRILDEHELHVYYYNFPKIGENTTKINRTITNKINTLYDDKIIKETDSIFIILNEPINDTTVNLYESLKLLLHEEKFDMTEMKKQMDEKNIKLQYKHFRNLFMFDINTLQINILEHNLVPKHEVIKDEDEKKEILDKCNSQLHEMPIISRNDPISKLLMCMPGDICKIDRISKTSGNYEYYRVCK